MSSVCSTSRWHSLWRVNGVWLWTAIRLLISSRKSIPLSVSGSLHGVDLTGSVHWAHQVQEGAEGWSLWRYISCSQTVQTGSDTHTMMMTITSVFLIIAGVFFHLHSSFITSAAVWSEFSHVMRDPAAGAFQSHASVHAGETCSDLAIIFWWNTRQSVPDTGLTVSNHWVSYLFLATEVTRVQTHDHFQQ